MANRNRNRHSNQHANADRPYQRAQREATNTPRHETVRFHDRDFIIHEDTFKDTEFIENMLVLEDPQTSEAHKARSGLKIARILTGNQWDELMKLIRARNNGIAHIDDTMAFVRLCIEAVAPEQPTS